MISFHTFKKIYIGQSILRVMMNDAIRGYKLRGTVLDLGGGGQSYLQYMDIPEDASLKNFDIKEGEPYHSIDFETDALPLGDESVDMVLCFNLLEHIYNHNFLVGEIHRVLKEGGDLKGFVPFWMKYHPDPKDFFRYTKEALERIFRDAGFRTVEIVEIGGSPILGNANNVILMFPRFLRPLVFLGYYLLDRLVLFFKPNSRIRTPLGFLFDVRK